MHGIWIFNNREKIGDVFKMGKLTMLTGKIKINVHDYHDIEGYENIKRYEEIKVLALQIENDKKLMLINPIEKEDIKKYYDLSYEDMHDLISDDYNYVIWYLLNEDCEFVNSIDINNLEDVREATEEEKNKAYSNMIEFKFNHGFYDYEAAYSHVEITKDLLENIKAAGEEEIPKIKIEDLKCFKIGISECDYDIMIAHNLNAAIKYYYENFIEGYTLKENEEYKIKELKNWKKVKGNYEGEEKTIYDFLIDTNFEYNEPTCIAGTNN